MTQAEFFNSVDYQLLQNQKLTLLHLLDSPALQAEQVMDLEGLVAFLDNFQDTAAETGIPEEVVFPV